MQTPLKTGSSIIVDAEKYVIQSVIGMGASSIVYYAQKENGRKVVVKEFYPIVPDCKRLEDGSVVVGEQDKGHFEEALSRFVSGFEMQFGFRNTNDVLANSISDAERIGEYNATKYIITSYMVGKSMEKKPPESMFQLLKLIRAAAVLMKEYHQQGYLHLDIKPENIFRRSDTDDTVMLFDFDSIKKIEDIREGKVELLSYSPIWAAPELRQGRMKDISEATDVFSLGAIIFSAFFNRSITALDCRSNSDWEFDMDNPILENAVSKTKLTEGLRAFFHKTIISNPKRRYQDVEQVIEALDGLLMHANTGEVKLLSTFKSKRDFFIGREKELEQMERLLSEAGRVFLYGVGGIGKSELAKQYASDKYDEYDAIVFGMCDPDVKSYIVSDKIITLLNWDEKSGRKEEDYEKKYNVLKRICNSQRVLLIVDNLDELEVDGLKDLETLGCDVIVTTRVDCNNLWMPCIAVEQIKDATQLFAHYYKKHLTEEDRTCVEKIVKNKLQGHTMFVVILANIMMRNRISPEEMLEKLENSEISQWGNNYTRITKDDDLKYDRVIQIGKSLFKFAQMTEVELYIMGNMSLMPRSGIDAKLFKELLKLESYETINQLSDKSMLQIDNSSDVIKLHPVVAEIFLDTISQHREWGTQLLEGLFRYLDTENGRCKEDELYDITGIISEIIHIYAIKQLDYDKFREVITNRILYGRMWKIERDIYYWKQGASAMRILISRIAQGTFEYYKMKIACLDVKIDDEWEEEYCTILNKLSAFTMDESYILRMHVITMLLDNRRKDKWMNLQMKDLKKCRTMFLESKTIFKVIQEKNEQMEIHCYCKRQLLLQAACIKNKIVEQKSKKDRKWQRITGEKRYICSKKIIKKLERETKIEEYYAELKEMYRLLYHSKDDWRLQFADALVEVGDLADTGSSMFVNSFFSEALSVYVNHFGYKNRIVMELCLKLAKKFDSHDQLSEAIEYYNKALIAVEDIYGLNSPENVSIHRALGKCYRLSDNKTVAKKEYSIAIELLSRQGVGADEIWYNFLKKMDIYIELKDYENALSCIEEALKQCAPMELDKKGYFWHLSITQFFQIPQYCDNIRNFEKCIEKYINIYIEDKEVCDGLFLEEAGDYFFESEKYYEAAQCYRLRLEEIQYEFLCKEDEYEYLMKICKCDAKNGNLEQAKDGIDNLLASCENYEIKNFEDLRFLIYLLSNLIVICNEDIQDYELVNRNARKCLRVLRISLSNYIKKPKVKV